MIFPFANYGEKEIKVGDAFTDDGRAQSYVYKQWGFFRLLDRANDTESHTYGDLWTTAEGNPIEIWRDPIIEDGVEVGYKGLSYDQLDFLYMSHSAEKILRDRYVLCSIGYPATDPTKAIIPARDATNKCVLPIVRMYRNKWVNLWETMFYEYNPIENYNMVEELINQVTEYEHGHIEELLNGRVNTRTGDVKETPGVTTTETHSVKGFDSDSFVGSDQDVTGHTGFNTTAYEQLKDTLSGTDKTTHSGTDTETKNYRLTRSGNIGVTTSQQMIESERQLLMFDYFNKIVFPDIDKIIALSVY